MLPFDFNHKLPPAGAEVQQPQWAETGDKFVFCGKNRRKKKHIQQACEKLMETSDDIWTSIKAMFYSCVMEMAVFMCCVRIKWDPLWWRTVFHRASWRSLMRLNPVVNMFPSAKKMALIGRAPSWALSFSWKQKQHLSDWAAMFVGSFWERLLHTRSIQAPNPCAALRLTAMTFFLRGSMTRTFLSLQAVQSRLPLRLQLTLKITSGCMSSRLIMASPVPTFQMTIWLSHPKMDTCSAAWIHSPLCPSLF